MHERAVCNNHDDNNIDNAYWGAMYQHILARITGKI